MQETCNARVSFEESFKSMLVPSVNFNVSFYKVGTNACHLRSMSDSKCMQECQLRRYL